MPTHLLLYPISFHSFGLGLPPSLSCHICKFINCETAQDLRSFNRKRCFNSTSSQKLCAFRYISVFVPWWIRKNFIVPSRSYDKKTLLTRKWLLTVCPMGRCRVLFQAKGLHCSQRSKKQSMPIQPYSSPFFFSMKVTMPHYS